MPVGADQIVRGFVASILGQRYRVLVQVDGVIVQAAPFAARGAVLAIVDTPQHPRPCAPREVNLHP